MRPSFYLLGLATAFGDLTKAHTLFTTLFINDINQGDGTCVRQPKDGNTCTAPIALPFSNPAMACGRDGQNAVAFSCPTPAGAKLTFEFRMFPDFAQPGVIDPSHKGPVAVYLKPVSSFEDSVTGGGWFKIWDEGYDASSKKFATEKLIANNGFLSIVLPPALPKGNYLVRTELIALQNVTESRGGNFVDAQFYVSCAQLFIESDNTGSLNVPGESQATIPGHISPDEMGLTFNIYDEPLKLPYLTPGPKVFFPGSENASPKAKAAAPLPVSEGGGVPPNCLLKNANWCGFEVKSYTTEAGCWAAVQDCYAQTDVCYKTAPPSGSKNCDVWVRQKCDVLRDSCSAGSFTGPPNRDKKLKEVFVNNVPKGDIPHAANGGAVPAGVGSGPGPGSGSPVVPEPEPTKTSSPSTPTASALPSVYLGPGRKKASSCAQLRRSGNRLG